MRDVSTNATAKNNQEQKRIRAQTSPRSLNTGKHRVEPALRKGEQTRQAIVSQALFIAAQEGFDGLSLGALADQMRMSKTGVFSRFGSLQALQIQVLHAYSCQFEAQVIAPACLFPPGLPRLKTMFLHWLHRIAERSGFGCLYISAASELDDRTGPLRDELVDALRAWRRLLEDTAADAIRLGQLREDCDPRQLVLELYALVLLFQHDQRLVKDGDAHSRTCAAFERLIAANVVDSGFLRNVWTGGRTGIAQS